MYPKDDEFPYIDYFAPDVNKRLEEMSKVVLTKYQRWEYEKEWRILQAGYIQEGLIDDSIESSDEERLNMTLEIKMEIATKSRPGNIIKIGVFGLVASEGPIRDISIRTPMICYMASFSDWK